MANLRYRWIAFWARAGIPHSWKVDESGFARCYCGAQRATYKVRNLTTIFVKLGVSAQEAIDALTALGKAMERK